MTELRYHVPLVGHVLANLHAESEQIYDSLSAGGEIDRLKRLDHLGLMRFAWEGAHHSRWEYTVLILSLIERCKGVRGIHLGSSVQIGDRSVSSGSELLKAWALLLNSGHLVWTFFAERALMLELWRQPHGARRAFLDAFDRPPVRAFAQDVLRNGQTYRFFQALALIRLAGFPADDSERRRLCLDVLEAYVAPPSQGDHVARLKRIYGNLRRLAFMALDTHYTPSVVRVELTQPLGDSDSLARLATLDETTQRSELDGLGAYLDRETYLGRRVMEEMAARDRNLRRLIRESLRRSSLQSTVEALALGHIQEQVVPSPLRTISRISRDEASVLGDLWPGRRNDRVEQANLDRDFPVRSDAAGLYWSTASGNDWVLQTFALASSPAPTVAAYRAMWVRAIAAHRVAAVALESGAADLFSERLASSLLLQTLPLFFAPELTWEWGTAGMLGEALFASRSSARRLIERESARPDLTRARAVELAMLGKTVGSGPTHVLISAAPLLAYQGAGQVAELDGCFAECDAGAIRLTLLEAKRMKSGALSAAVKSMKLALERLGTNKDVRVGQVFGKSEGPGTARAWMALEFGTLAPPTPAKPKGETSRARRGVVPLA